MNKKYTRYLAFFAAGIIVMILIFPEILPFSIFGSKQDKKTVEGNKPATGVVIDAQVVETESFKNNIVLAGSLLANESVQLISEISAKVDKIYFKEGDYVKKGQLLLTTNMDDLQARLKRLEYTNKLNQKTEKRQKKLLDSEAISAEEYDQTFTSLKTTEAEMEEIQAEIEKAKIVAPFGGYVGLRYISEGSYITPNTQIASLYNVNPIKIEFSVPSRYTKFINKGQMVEFSSEAEDENRTATIYAIEPQIDEVTRTLKVRAKCDNKDNSLIPGQFVRVQLNLESDPDAILIPTTAIMPKADGHLVYLIKGDKAYAQEVRLGIRTATEVEIVQGIEKGDTIATAGVPQLKDRASITIKSLEQAKQ